MLKNTTNATLTLKYNGISRQVAPGQTIDIARAYDLQPSEVMPQEARIRAKYPGLLDASQAVASVSEPVKVAAPEIPNFAQPEDEIPQRTNVETLMVYSKAQLIEMAKNLGLENITAKRSKEKLIEMIDDAMKKAGG